MAKTDNPTRASRALTVVRQTAATLGVITVAGATIVVGVSILTDRAAAVPELQAASPIPVHTAKIRIEESYSLPRNFIGQIEARSSVALSFELSGRLQELLVDEGDEVHEGQLIARLDTDLLEAEVTRLTAARAAFTAQLAFAENRLARAVRLQKAGFTSTETLDQAQAARDELTNRIAETDASLQSVQISIAKSTLYAPFGGQIAAQSADAAETIQPGREIVVVMETSVPELRVGLPLDITAEQLNEAKAEVAGRQVAANLKRVRPDIDPVTRTRTGLFALKADDDLLFGQTATLRLETRVAAQGAWIPVDALQSGEGSVWTIMIVDQNILHNAAVEILHIEGRRAYVRGTFMDGMQIVLSGAHRVVSGQMVTIIDAGL